MTYLLLGFVAPGVGVFPYLIGLSRITAGYTVECFGFFTVANWQLWA